MVQSGILATVASAVVSYRMVPMILRTEIGHGAAAHAAAGG